MHLVAAVVDDKDCVDPDKRLMDFVFDLTMMSKIQNQVEQVFIYHSKDDPEVPYAHAEKIKLHIPEAKLITFTDRGHFLGTEFPELLENILQG